MIRLNSLGHPQSLERDNLQPTPSPSQRPLSPPDTLEQKATPLKRLSDTLSLFRECQKEFWRVSWAELSLNPHEYDALWISLSRDADLQAYIVDKSRYVRSLPNHVKLVAILTLMISADSTGPHETSLSAYGCRRRYMTSSRRWLSKRSDRN